MPPTRKITSDVAAEIMWCWRVAGRREITASELERALWARGVMQSRQSVGRTLHAYGWRRSGHGRWSCIAPVARVMQLSPHFSLPELTRSSTGRDNTPTPDVVEHLARLCRDVLEPVRVVLCVPLRVTSGFRSPEVNTAVGGSPTSQHMRGDAADVVPVGMTAEEAMRRIAHEVEAGRLPHLDQAIVYASGFLHLSASSRPRQQLLRSASKGGSGGPYTAYKAS